MELVSGFTFDAAHIVPLLIAIVVCLILLKIIRSAIKWAVIAAIVGGALIYFHVI